MLFYRQTEKQSGPSPVCSQMLSVNLTIPNINDNGNCMPVHSSQSSPSRRNTAETSFSNVLKKETYTCGNKNSIKEGNTANKKEKRLPVKEHDNESLLLQNSQTPISNKAKKQTSTCVSKDSSEKNDTANKVKEKHNDENPLLKIGHRFYNIEEVKRAKELYEQKHFCELWKRDTRTMESAKKRVPKRVEHAEMPLNYYSLKLACKFGGKDVDSKKLRKRKTNSFRQGCPFEVYLVLSQDGKALEVSNVTLDHNHSPSKELYQHLPRQRRLRGNLRQHGVEVLRLKANSKMFQQEIESSTGHRITLKDIANLKYEDKKMNSSNDIEEVVNYLKSQDGSVVDVIVDQEGDFKCLLYQDQYMKNVYSNFPELVMVDATYKLLDLRMPVYIMLAIDKEGSSEIVAIFVVSEETNLVISSAVESFKKHNPAWSKTVTVFSDKNVNERQAFTKCFPHAKLLLCLFHTLRSFKREVTTDERIRCLEIITQVVYSKSPAEYDHNVKKLKDTRLQSVIQYYEQNWEPIKEQFVACYKNSIVTFGETTTNRLESTNAKIKSVCSRHGSLRQFFSEMFVVLGALRNERRHKQLMALSCLPTDFQSDDTDMKKYRMLLTPYAYQKLEKQAELEHKVKVTTVMPDDSIIVKSSINSTLKASSMSCECNYVTMMGIPCRHILKARRVHSLPRYDESLVSKRWTKCYSRTATKVTPTENTSNNNTCNVIKIMADVKCLTQAQKYRKAGKLTNSLASLASEGGTKTFSHRMIVLRKLLNMWMAGKDVKLGEINTSSPEKTAKDSKVPSNPTITKNDSNNKENDSRDKNFTNIKMPTKMLKRGRPKGSEQTVIGLPKKEGKKVKDHY